MSLPEANDVVLPLSYSVQPLVKSCAVKEQIQNGKTPCQTSCNYLRCAKEKFHSTVLFG